MNYFLYFLTDGLLGYFMQAVGYILSLYAFTRKKPNLLTMFLVSLLLAVMMFGIRQITVISFGYHTILIMISLILIGVIWLKTPTFLTVLSVMSTTIVILICEVINLEALSLIFGKNTIMPMLQNTLALSDKIYKSLLGAPTNITLVIIMLVAYIIRLKTNNPKKIDKDIKESANEKSV